MNVQNDKGFSIYQSCYFHKPEDVVCPVRVVTAGRVAVEASCTGSLYISGIVKIGRESKDDSLDRHLELLLPYIHGRKVQQLPRFEAHFLDDTVHLVKNVEGPPVRKSEVFAETVGRDDHLVSVDAIFFLDRWCRIAGDSAFRHRYEAICETREM